MPDMLVHQAENTGAEENQVADMPQLQLSTAK